MGPISQPRLHYAPRPTPFGVAGRNEETGDNRGVLSYHLFLSLRHASGTPRTVGTAARRSPDTRTPNLAHSCHAMLRPTAGHLQISRGRERRRGGEQRAASTPSKCSLSFRESSTARWAAMLHPITVERVQTMAEICRAQEYETITSQRNRIPSRYTGNIRIAGATSCMPSSQALNMPKLDQAAARK